MAEDSVYIVKKVGWGALEISPNKEALNYNDKIGSTTRFRSLLSNTVGSEKIKPFPVLELEYGNSFKYHADPTHTNIGDTKPTDTNLADKMIKGKLNDKDPAKSIHNILEGKHSKVKKLNKGEVKARVIIIDSREYEKHADVIKKLVDWYELKETEIRYNSVF